MRIGDKVRIKSIEWYNKNKDKEETKKSKI